MAGGIFVSYRRDDSRDIAGRLVDHLRRTFSVKDLFLDVDTIAPGVRFDQALSDKVDRCAVMLAIIGPTWVSMKDKDGRRRIDDPNDYLRREVAVALQRGVPVIPVLVSGASLPDPADLPDDLKGLVMRQKVDLRFERFNADADALVASLAHIVRKKPPIALLAGIGSGAVLLAAAGIFLATRPGGAPATPQPVGAVSDAGAKEFVALCREAMDVTSRLVSTTDPETWRTTSARFWELYNGPLYTVETAQKKRSKEKPQVSQLETAMVEFGWLIPQATPPGKLPRGDLQVPSLHVAKACTEVIEYYGGS